MPGLVYIAVWVAAVPALSTDLGPRSLGTVEPLAAVASAAEAAQEEQYRERQVLDPQTDTWVEQAVALPGTPEAELDEARALLARGEVRAAYGRLKKWVETHREHERYFEALLLLGEACFGRERFYQAYERFEEVVENTAGELFYKALLREVDVARAFLAGRKRIIWGFLPLPAYDDGVEILDRVWERVPGTRLGEDALRLKAEYFFGVGDYQLAQDEYANLAREYPSGRFVRLAMLRAAVAAQEAFPGTKFDDRALLDAEEGYRQVKAAFPEFAQREGVDERLEAIARKRAEKDLEIARWYERTQATPAAAFYYQLILREHPQTLEAVEARRRLRALGFETPEESAAPQQETTP